MILIAGRAGSGKSSLAQYLCREHEYSEASLADPMKRFCREIFGWDEERLWGPSEARNAPDPEWDGLSARHALQQLGTEWGRAMHPDLWIRYLLRTAPDRCVVSDIRFPNELAAMQDHGAYSVLMLGGPVGDTHVSEMTQWAQKDFDVVVPRYATVTDMCHATRDHLAHIGAL